MRVGWLGLGAMGAPMAACLARAGHESLVRRGPGAGPRAGAAGGRAADSAAAAAAAADVVAIMVATPEQLEHVLFGAAGVPGTGAAFPEPR